MNVAVRPRRRTGAAAPPPSVPAAVNDPHWIRSSSSRVGHVIYMNKTVIAPGQGRIESDELEGPQVSLAVATHHADCTRVEINGLVYPDGSVREQTREMLGLIERILDDLDGSMTDVVKLRWYVDESVLDPDTRGTIHEVRAEFFEYPQFPASCMIGVPASATDGGDVELEASATIPTDGDWAVRTITGDE